MLYFPLCRLLPGSSSGLSFLFFPLASPSALGFPGLPDDTIHADFSVCNPYSNITFNT